MADTPSFPIVGIGASAGGIEALEGFFGGMPERPGLAFIIVTHLSPERDSLLHEVIARHTTLPVHVAVDGMTVQSEHIYVLPAHAVLGIESGRLQLRRTESDRRERNPIDIFFSALAIDCRELAVGVVLSGGDGDGTLGIKAIKERGGLTLAQVHDGFGPQHPDMPNSAMSTGLVDLALPADQMGPKLADFARSLGMFGDGPASPNAADSPSMDDARRDIYAILRNQLGHDFGGYKSRTFLRRVHRRMQMRQVSTIEAYVERLRQEPEEVGALFRDLLINVTNFFRDAEAFEVLATSVIPKLFEERKADETVRVWVPGCATGEEVYSIAILLREHMAQLTVIPRIQVFATDIDESALSVARAGRYPVALLESVSAERRDRFFVADAGSYVVAKEVRDLCIFSPHSVIRDPPFSRIDLVSCRNLLIYFGIDVQNDVIPTFHYALRPDGFLFLGTSENISQFGELFAPIDKKQRIFRRRSSTGSPIRLPVLLNTLRPVSAADPMTRKHVGIGGLALRQAVETQVLETFSPPHVVVNQDGEIVFYSARTGKYLEAAAGLPTRQLLAIARKGLRLDLRTALRETAESGRPVTREGVAVEGEDGRVQMIALTITPLANHNGSEPLFLVLFADEGPTLSRDEALHRVSVAHDGAALQLERELRDTRERLQSLIEEYETALEELKSSNEELVSVNEELQSTNEELEGPSKEELQSVNEELHTVNSDLSSKVEALDLANGDLRNLFDSSNVATLFLDARLVIRSFTPSVSKIFNILPSDRGRPIADLATRLTVPELSEGLAEVLAHGRTVERRAANWDGKTHYLVRLSPYRNTERQTRGVIASFIDVSEIMDAEARQGVLLAELQHRTRNLLAIVQSIGQQTLERGPRFDTFSVRLASLARVQGLISAAADDEVDFGDIVRLELDALSGMDGRISIAGPPVALRIEQVQMLALALHELATNALKFGALHTATGHLAVSWQVNASDVEPRMQFTWQESGLPTPPDGSRQGYGRKLIERALAYSLQAKTDLVFDAEGIIYHLDMPLSDRKRQEHD